MYLRVQEYVARNVYKKTKVVCAIHVLNKKNIKYEKP